MHESNMLLVGIIDFLKITSELIEIDLIIQLDRHLVDSTEYEKKQILQLKLRRNIFRLIDIKNDDIMIEAEEWYFQKMKELNSLNIVANQNSLIEKSIEILHGLDKFRMRSI